MKMGEEQKLNIIEWPKARRDMLLKGEVSEYDWGRMSPWQQQVCHQIELTIKSVGVEDLTELEEEL